MMTARKTATIDQPADEWLVSSYRVSGNQSDLATLYLRYTDLVYGTALKYLKQREAAKDAVMNIYQELVTKLQTAEVSNFRSWLYVVTKHHCLMKIRSEKKAVVVELHAEQAIQEDFSSLDDLLEKEQAFRQLEKCIDLLGGHQKRAIELFYLERKCYKEISDNTGMAHDSIRSLLQNGRRNLKICMEKNIR